MQDGQNYTSKYFQGFILAFFTSTKFEGEGNIWEKNFQALITYGELTETL